MSLLGKVTLLTGRSTDDGKSYEEWVNTDHEWKNLKKPIYHQNTWWVIVSDCWITCLHFTVAVDS